MKTRFLFPTIYRLIGYILAVPGFVLGYFVVYNNYEIPGFGFKMRAQNTLLSRSFENYTNELALTLVIVGLVFIAFSKTKGEDELTGKIRLNALYWSVLVNYTAYAGFMLLSLLNFILKSAPLDQLLNGIIGGDKFLAYNFVTPLLTFILRFYYLQYKNRADGLVTEVKLIRNAPFSAIGKWLSIALIAVMLFNAAFIDVNNATGIFWILPLTLLIWVYAKEKDEDEYIKALRLDAMHVGIYANYAILIVSNFMFYSIDFLGVQVINLVTIPLIFVIRFQYRLYRLRRSEAKSTFTLSL